MDKIRRIKITERTVIENKIIGDPSDRGDVIEIVGPRASGTIIRNCTVYGGIRIYGAGKNGQSEAVRQSSKRAGHTGRMQDAAPNNVHLLNLRITANRRVPVYFAPGVWGCTLERCSIYGSSVSSVVYLDAESGLNKIRNNFFWCRSPREVISIDGSAGNTIFDNNFPHSLRGGVYVYRNTGEGGTARHQEPRRNRIMNNEFRYFAHEPRVWRLPRATIWLSYDDLWRWLAYSWQDRRIPYGSGKSNRDFARENTVEGNKFIGKPWWIRAIRDRGRDNTVQNKDGGT